MIKIGIPRGMNYYDAYHVWINFFEALGAEVIVSNKTNKEILDSGVLNTIDDACLPVKVFHGHVFQIKDKVDYIFIPRIISFRKREFECPKILGLPAMVKSTINNLPEIIDLEINMRKSKFHFKKEVIKISKIITKDPIKIKKAYDIAIKNTNFNKTNIYSKIIPEIQNIDEKSKIRLLLLGHPYNIYDKHINMNIIEKLYKRGIEIITTDMLDEKDINEHILEIPKRMFWTSGRKIVGGSFSLLNKNLIDGIIFISSFGCGLDSILIDIVQRKAKSKKIPFSLLTLDEHTGEAGINTRIEAFVDMLEWRGKNEDNISTYG